MAKTKFPKEFAEKLHRARQRARNPHQSQKILSPKKYEIWGNRSREEENNHLRISSDNLQTQFCLRSKRKVSYAVGMSNSNSRTTNTKPPKFWITNQSGARSKTKLKKVSPAPTTSPITIPSTWGGICKMTNSNILIRCQYLLSSSLNI